MTGGNIESHLEENSEMLREIITYVESMEYECQANLASGVTSLKHFMEQDSQIIELVRLCKDRSVAIFMLGHMLELSTRQFDLQYRHPSETAMATYLHAITQARPELIKPAVAVAQSLKNSFWPRQYTNAYLV